MDFHSLPRKQLQALCKKNKIPANMTNVAMADSLAALHHVEGIEEVWNPTDTDAQKCPDEKAIGTPACRTSTRRKPVIEEPESSKVSTRPRRVTRARNDEGIDQENKDLNVPPVTPAGPTTSRRAPAVSTRRKKEDEKQADHVTKTPAASNSRMKAASGYNTRKSTRLLEKGLSKMSLMDKDMSVELSSVSQQLKDSVDAESGDSSLAKSIDVIEEIDEIESVKVDEISEEMTDLPDQKIQESEDAVEEGSSSLAISTEVIEEIDETEPVKVIEETDETESVKVDEISEEMTDLPREIDERGSVKVIEETDVTESVKVDEISEEMTDLLQEIDETESVKVIEETDETESVKVDEMSEEMIDLPQEIEESEDALEEGANSQTISMSSEKNTEFECQSKDSNSDMSLASEEESDTGASPQVVVQESVIKVNESGSPLKDMNNSSESEVVVQESLIKVNESGSPLKDTNNSSEADIELTKAIAKEVNDANNESGNEFIRQIENDAFSFDKQKNNEHTNMGNDNQNSVLLFSSHAENETVVEREDDTADFAEIHVFEVNDEVDVSLVVEDKNEASEHSNVGKEAVEIALFSAEKKKAVEIAHDIKEVMIPDENKATETACVNQNFEEEMFSAEKKVVETSCDIQNSEVMFSAQKKEIEVEDLGFETSSGIEELRECEENDAVMEACNEPSSEANTNVRSAADSLSSGDMNAQGADSQSQLVVGKEAEAEFETADDQIGNEEDRKEITNVPTVTFAPEVQLQFSCQDEPALKDNAAVEVKSIRKMCNEEGDKQNENQINDDLGSKSMRQLRKMLKNLSLDNKTCNDKINNSGVKDVERKRTALQQLPENRMTASKGQSLLLP